AGFKKADSLHSVRIDGADKPGVGARFAKALAEAGINLRGLSGATLGNKLVAYLALDTAADAAKAASVLKKLT
ncbi:MAG TPA: ACT domain-containing protein, partial [Bacillota bacterium]|nr:ACT domain-containing protein [Bacillota bacterium]